MQDNHWLGYTRVSRVGDRGDRLISPELQEQRIRGYAASRGIELEMMPPELDVSGGKSVRPILEQVIEKIEDGLVAGVIVAQLDRLSRMALADALRTIERIESIGGQVIAVAENFDATTPEGRMARNVLLSLADMQLGRYKDQFATVKRRAVEQGVWPISRVPLGYKKGGDRRLVPDARAGDVRRGFETRAVGRPWSAVADAIGGVGISGANKIVTNRVYLGEIRYRIRGEEVVNPMAHPALVDRALFEAAQLNHPRPARRGNPAALLGGLLRCAECGYVMSRNAKARSSEWFYCCRPRKARKRCPAPAIVGAVGIEALVERTVLAHLASLRFEAIARTGEVDAAGEALIEAEGELAAYQDAVSVSDIGADNFTTGMRSRVAAVERARRALAEARLRSAPLPDAGDLAGLWPKLTVEERRHVLRGSLSAVVVRKGTRDLLNRVRVFAPDAVLTFPLGDGDLPGEIRLAATKDIE